MSDILIRGMEIPEGCLSCNLRATSGVDEWMCTVNKMRFPSWENGWRGDKYRHVDCPLVELPEHGDLIDRDALPEGRVEWEDIVNAPVVIPANKEETE